MGSEQGDPKNSDRDRIDELGDRIKRARAPEPGNAPNSPQDSKETARAVSQALRVSAELLSGLIVGTGMGWLLDRWLETTPWLMLVFFFLGAGAGILNVYRVSGLTHDHPQMRDGARDDAGDGGPGQEK